MTALEVIFLFAMVALLVVMTSALILLFLVICKLVFDFIFRR